MKKLGSIIGAALVVAFIGLTVVFTLIPLSSSDLDIYRGKVDTGYEITDADYNITVSEDHTARVVERLTVLFNEPSNGIFRYLPTNSGEQYSNITVTFDGDKDDTYFVETDVDFIVIGTGEREPGKRKKYGGGEKQTYVISYNIVPPVSTAGNTNYYMNVVPFGWDTRQRNVKITMSFPYDIEDIDVFVGSFNTTNKSAEDEYTVEGNELTMFIDRLDAFNGVTVDVELGHKFNVNFSLPGLMSILIILALIAGAVCIKLFAVKDRKVFPIINANPPHDNGVALDPAQMGFLIDNRCEPTDVTAMIFYFASQGLLRLENQGKDNFLLIKTGEIAPDAPEHQKIIFNGLFKNRDTVSTKQLQDKFYNNVTAATAKVKSNYAGKLSESKASSISIISAVAAGLITALIAFIMTKMLSSATFIVDLFVPFAIMAVFIAAGFLFGRYVFDHKHKISQKKLLASSVGAGALAIIASLIVSYFVFGGIFPYYGRTIIYAGLAVVGFACGLIKRKSEYYASLMNEITGFKEFLETAEKDRLETMLEDNPQYYYDILPYANVLGVSKKWEDKFASLANVPPPNYYTGPTVFDFIVFNSLMRSSYVKFTSAMVSRPSSSSHSGGGRGGFGGGRGGGGFGGGGGGRR